MQFVLLGQQPKKGWFRTSEYEVQFNTRQSEAFEAIRSAIEQRREVTSTPAEEVAPETSTPNPVAHSTRDGAQAPVEETPPEANAAPASTSRVAGGSEILNKKLKTLVNQHITEDEAIEFCLISLNMPGWTQAIVALQDRLLVIKPGIMAGAAFGARVTSFYYPDINGIEINTGLINGVIEINTPSYQGTGQKDFWNIKDKDKDPNKVTNCLPIAKSNLKHYKPYIDRLRKMIREAKRGHSAPPPAPDPAAHSASSLVSELEKLASLRDSGVLTEEEFQQAKKRLLN